MSMSKSHFANIKLMPHQYHDNIIHLFPINLIQMEYKSILTGTWNSNHQISSWKHNKIQKTQKNTRENSFIPLTYHKQHTQNILWDKSKNIYSPSGNQIPSDIYEFYGFLMANWTGLLRISINKSIDHKIFIFLLAVKHFKSILHQNHNTLNELIK